MSFPVAAAVTDIDSVLAVGEVCERRGVDAAVYGPEGPQARTGSILSIHARCSRQ